MLIIIEMIKSLGLLMLLSVGYVYLASFTKDQLQAKTRDLIIGLMFGLLIATVMLDPIRLAGGATFDPRGGPAVLAGVFGGPIGAVIAGIIGSVIRWYVVGGPFALGGVVGFCLYGTFGIIAGLFIKKYQIKINFVVLVLLGVFGTISVLPAFFVNADLATGIVILEKAGPILITNNILGTLIVGIFVVRAKQWSDVRKRLKIEEAENARLALIARNTTNGIIITDAQGYVEWINEGFERISGYSLEDLIGKKPGSILQGKNTDPEIVKQISSCLKKGESFDVEIVNYSKTGVPYWVQIYCQPYKDLEGKSKFMAIQADITARKDVDSLKTNFISLVSHELRTPLTSIKGSIGLVQSGALGVLDDKIKDMMDIAHNNTQRLLRLVDDILDFEKLQFGSMEFKFQEMNLVECVNDSIEMNTSYATGRGVTLKFEKTDDQIMVIGDRDRLLQVMANLISNASKYSPENETVTISISQNNDHATVKVVDLGPGIPEYFVDKVFTKFTQAETGNERDVKGTGLGLSISKAIIEQHHGTIDFDREVSAGSSFYFVLPLRN